jgi:DNA-binding CsgD family transcriptional regulator
VLGRPNVEPERLEPRQLGFIVLEVDVQGDVVQRRLIRAERLGLSLQERPLAGVEECEVLRMPPVSLGDLEEHVTLFSPKHLEPNDVLVPFPPLVYEPSTRHDVVVTDVPPPRPTSLDLLERERELGMLASALHEVASSKRGRLVLLSGEAGVGKTTIAQAFCKEHSGSRRVLQGRCESLFAPRPLGPILDLALDTGGPLADCTVHRATPHEVTTTLIQELQDDVTILVLEDMHWADQATLDVLDLLGHRLEQTPTLVLVTYRGDEVDRRHPLQRVFGDLAVRRDVSRLTVSPLSRMAVEQLAKGQSVDPDEVYALTGGNPFYVVEVLASPGTRIPPTVRDAVLARAARLSPRAQRVLDVVAVAHPKAETWLLEAEASVEDLDDCLASGMLESTSSAVSFRHELARVAVEESIAPALARELNRRVLARLEAPPHGATDLARLAHHAEAAGDAAAVLRYAPAAAEQASSVGAHREAAAQYTRALQFAGDLDLATRADLLTRHSYECYLTAQDDPALASIAHAVECYRELGDDHRLGATLRWHALALLNWGRAREALDAAHEAISVLERLDQGHELAMAYNVVAALAMLDDDSAEVVLWARRALELAGTVGSTEARVAALGYLGRSDVLMGLQRGWGALDEALALARAAQLENQVGRTYALVAMTASRERSLPRLREYLEPALAFCEERDLDSWADLLLAARSWLELEEGDWDSCAATVTQVLARECMFSSLQARIVLGIMRARRGDPDPWTPLARADEVAGPTGQLWWTFQVAAARAEAAWLEGRIDEIARATDAAYSLAVGRQARWPTAELAWWRALAGIGSEVPEHAAGPFATMLRGDWRRASAQWVDAGCPYQAALALAEGDEEAQRRALDQLTLLGARPGAAIVARRLRERGVRGVPRGPRPATRESPAGLTSREAEVLQLLAEGLRNAQIAQRLVVSRRTVDHHVAAILRKLRAASRGEAVAVARRLELFQDGSGLPPT